VTFATGAGAQAWSYSDNVGYSTTDTITVTVTDPARTTVTKTASATTGPPPPPPSVSVAKGAHCGPGTTLPCQTPEVCNNSDCYRITVVTSGFSTNVTCNLNSSLGSGGWYAFTMGGNATDATPYWFGAPGGWVSATCNGVTGTYNNW
jgi:large repetitive protein